MIEGNHAQDVCDKIGEWHNHIKAKEKKGCGDKILGANSYICSKWQLCPECDQVGLREVGK